MKLASCHFIDLPLSTIGIVFVPCQPLGRLQSTSDGIFFVLFLVNNANKKYLCMEMEYSTTIEYLSVAVSK